jgi:hypothetical protein
MIVDDDHFIDRLTNMICDTLSPSFVLCGVGVDDLRAILEKHGVEFNMTIDLCRRALCHHILNGLCAKGDGEECRLIVGRYQPHIVGQHLSSALLDLISKPDFPLDVICTVCAGLGYCYSGVGERQYLKCALQKRHDRLFTHGTDYLAYWNEVPQHFLLVV